MNFLVIRPHRNDGRLLEHYFRDPDPVRVRFNAWPRAPAEHGDGGRTNQEASRQALGACPSQLPAPRFASCSSAHTGHDGLASPARLSGGTGIYMPPFSSHWPEIVGEDYARVTTPVKISFPHGKPAAEKWANGQREDGILLVRLPQGIGHGVYLHDGPNPPAHRILFRL